MTARIVVTGNAATAPDTKITSTGRTRTVFRIGSTDRRLDRDSGEWVDGDRFFIGVTCWGPLADNVAASVKLGTPVVVTGRIAQRTYTDKHEQVQFTYEVTADTVAPDLSRGTANFVRANKVTGRSIATDGSGHAAMGVTEDPDGRTTVAASGADEHHGDIATVLGGDRFQTATGLVLEAPHDAEEKPADGREDDLVGAPH